MTLNTLTVNGYHAIEHVLDRYKMDVPVTNEGETVMLCQLDKYQTFDSFVIIQYLEDSIETCVWSDHTKTWHTMNSKQ